MGRGSKRPAGFYYYLMLGPTSDCIAVNRSRAINVFSSIPLSQVSESGFEFILNASFYDH
jgi:hypothetical protein